MAAPTSAEAVTLWACVRPVQRQACLFVHSWGRQLCPRKGHTAGHHVKAPHPTTPPCADTYVNCSVAVDDNNSAKIIYRCNPGAKLDHKNAIVGWVYRKVG